MSEETSFVATLCNDWATRDTTAITTIAGASVSYGQLDEMTRQAVAWLQQHSLKRGDVLAMQGDRGLPFICTVLGAMRLGVTVLPLNQRYTTAEVGFFVKDSGAKLAVVQPGVAIDNAEVSCIAAQGLKEQLEGCAPAALPAPPTNTELAFIAYTSGTTGRPKGAMISYRNLQATLQALHHAWGWSDQDRSLHVLPLTHIHGLFVSLFGALYARAETILLPRFDPEMVMDTIEQHHCTVFMGVPTLYHRLLREDRQMKCDSVRLFTSGSAPLPARTHAAFEQRYGHTILERYGMTEVGIVLSNPLDGPRIPGAIGSPLPGVEAKVVNDAGLEVIDEVGELLIKGASVISGYLGLPEATADSIVDGWMHTGDLATKKEGIFRIVGRSKDMIISGGLNIYPSEVEQALLKQPSILEAAVIGLPDDDFGERVVAYIVLAETVTEADILAGVAPLLAPYKRPKQVRFIQELPRNAMGKVMKGTLRTKR